MKESSPRYIYEGGTARHPRRRSRLNFPDTRTGTSQWQAAGGNTGPILSAFEVGWLLVFLVGWVALW